MNSSTTSFITETQFVTGILLPDTALAHEATELIRDTESALLFNHSSRVFCFASLAGQRRTLKFDPELLYVGASSSYEQEKHRGHKPACQWRSASSYEHLHPLHRTDSIR